MKVFLINHQEGRNRDIITIFFPIKRCTGVLSGLFASYKHLEWKICGCCYSWTNPDDVVMKRKIKYTPIIK